jgi:hypothetical protein
VDSAIVAGGDCCAVAAGLLCVRTLTTRLRAVRR